MDRQVYVITDGDERRLGTVAEIINPESSETFVEWIQAIRHAVADMVFGPDDRETSTVLVEIR